MSFPGDSVVKGREIRLGCLVSLMRIAADSQEMDAVAHQVAREAEYFPLKEPALSDYRMGDDLMARRMFRLHDICKEALPYMTMIYEIERKREEAEQKAGRLERALDNAKEANNELRGILCAIAPHLFKDHDDEN